MQDLFDYVPGDPIVCDNGNALDVAGPSEDEVEPWTCPNCQEVNSGLVRQCDCGRLDFP
jgi:hypothetical protein